MSERRVVITGMGAISPFGLTVDALWDGLVSGRPGIRRIQRFNSEQFDVHIGGECLEFDPGKYVDVRAAKRMDRFAQFALAASIDAAKQAGLEPGTFDTERAGVILGTGIGGIAELEEQHRRLIDKGPSKVSAFTIPKLMANACAGQVSIHFGIKGPSFTTSTACASAGTAMGEGWHAIRRNTVDVVIVGGAEAACTPLGIGAFAAMKALSTRNDDPATASRPFDKDRDGFVLSEGAGVVVLEEYEHARRRGAPILAELIGFGASSDAGDLVAPDPQGLGAGRAMAAALQSAALAPDRIDYINAHGTSTPLGDLAETVAIKAIFGPAARKVAISSTKSQIGHLLGASGGVEGIACILAMRHNTLPPTINLANPDPMCDLDYVPNVARDAQVRISMSNSFGFGGHNTCLIFRKV